MLAQQQAVGTTVWPPPMAEKITSKKLRSGFQIGQRNPVPEALLAAGLSFYKQGRYLDAFAAVQSAGPLQSWTGASALTFGYRLAGNLGASRLASLLICRGYREDPLNPDAAVYYGYRLQQYKGPLPAWKHALQVETLPGLTTGHRADVLTMRAFIAAQYRDFETAWKLWGEASALSPGDPWIITEKAAILLCQEKRVEALEAVDEALAERAWFRPAVQHKARILHLLGRWDEAIRLLTESLDHAQSYALAVQLLNLKREVDDHEGMSGLVDQAQSLAILAESDEMEWFQARRADILCLKGDYEAAATAADAVSGKYYPGLATRLRSPEVSPRRVRLGFEFVHQKHNTCAPATLAAMAHFWSREITMEQITDAICYDGTYDYSERSWCEANGFASREFCVTVEAARTLLDEGVPFVISTVEIGSAHAQAVIGYDELRQTFFIQDPSEPHYREVPAAEFLESYRLTGPRGLVVVPQEKAGWLASLDLPEQELYDWNYRFNLALSTYDRETAVTALQEMEALAPGHRLPLLARLSLASFDGNEVTKAECIDQLLALFPEDLRLLNWKAMSLRTLGRREDRIQTLRHAPALTAMHPVLLRELGTELLEDARDWKQAARCLWTAHAMMPGDAPVLIRIAGLLSRTHTENAEELLTYYRFAAAASDKVEGYAQVWFSYAMSQGKTEEALQWLRRRMQEYGSKSGAPALTLVQALDALGRPEMVEVMREAVSRRPDDGELLLYLARVESRLGAFEEADSLLSRAYGKAYPAAWLRTKASLLRRQGQLAAEQEVWKEVLVREPLALDAHHMVARDLAATQGAFAAADYFQEVCRQFPHHYELGQQLAAWLREARPAEAVVQLEAMIALHPADSWAYRELALMQRDLTQPQAALDMARKSCEVAPDQPASHAVLALMQEANGQEAAAIESYHQAIRLDVNYSPAYDGLFQTVLGTERQRQELDFIRAEMIRQVLNGNGLHSYRRHAFTVLSPEELLGQLKEIWQVRPDLWEAWSVYIAQLLDSGEGFQTEALQVAQDAVERFPLVPGAWADLAAVQRWKGDKEGAIQTMERTLQLNPDWANAWQQLVELQDDFGRSGEAVETARRSLARLPLDTTLQRCLGVLLWKVGEREEAWALVQKIVDTDPGQDWGWECLKTWAGPLQKSADLIAFGRAVTAQRPNEARSWIILARLLPLEKITEILKALNRAITLNPKLIDAYDYRAEILARLGRLDEAERSLRQEPFSRPELTPYNLRGRLAWLKAIRQDYPGAMSEMRAVLEIHRDYFWGWEMLATWAEESKNLAEWRRAAAEMIRLNPRSAVFYCTAADAELSARQKDKGLQYLQQALHMDPDSPYAAQRLLGIHWEANDLKGVKAAAETLTDDGTVGLIKKVYLMLVTAVDGQEDRTRIMLHELAVHPDMMGPLLTLIFNHFNGTWRRRAAILDEVLQQVVREDTIGPAFAMLWVQKECQKQNWHAWIQLARWLPRLGSRLDPAIGNYLDMIGEAAAGNPHVQNFVERCGPMLRVRGEIWGKVSYAFASCQAFRACVDWVWPDYKRPDAEGWVLSNLSLSLRRIRDPQRASLVSLHVIEQGIRDQTWPTHVGIAALGLANGGEFARAKALLEREPLDQADFEPRLLALTARALCDVMSLQPSEARFWFKQFLKTTKPLIGGSQLSPQLQKDYEDAVEKMRRHSGVTLMPWQKVKTRTYTQPSESSGISRVAIWIGVFLLIQVLRHCSSSPSFPSSYVPPRTHTEPSVQQTMDQARRALERFEQTSPKPAYEPRPARLEERLDSDLNMRPFSERPLPSSQDWFTR